MFIHMFYSQGIQMYSFNFSTDEYGAFCRQAVNGIATGQQRVVNLVLLSLSTRCQLIGNLLSMSWQRVGNRFQQDGYWLVTSSQQACPGLLAAHSQLPLMCMKELSILHFMLADVV